jgi:predicted glycoside hydrolase/deacetylase ChbG (UPF0249 family)
LKSKKLVVNADDFGLSHAINAGILRSHLEGIVTSTSLVAAGSAFDEAVVQARLNPALGVGVHLTLVEESAVSSKIPTLAPRGVLPKTYGALIKGLSTGRIRLLDIEKEFRAQIEKCLAAGLDLTHVDSHQHTHAWPLIFARAVRVANDYKIRGIRIPRGWPSFRDLSADRFLAKCVLALAGQFDASFFSRGACVTTQRFAGLFESGRLIEASLLQLLGEVQPGTTELMCHPGCNDPSGKYAKWNARRQTEMASLTSQSVKQAIRDLGIELISYRQL